METTRRTVRVPDKTWEAAKTLAVSRGENLSEVIRRSLQRYVQDNTTDDTVTTHL